MKRVCHWTIMICVLTLVSHDVFAEGRQMRGIRLGMKGGVSFATLSGAPVSAYDARIGFSGGAFVRIPITPSLSIQPEVLYTQKGAKASGFCSGVPTTWTIKLDYVEIPVLLSASLSDAGNIAPRVFLGPAMTFKASFREEAKNGNGANTVDISGLRTNEICFVFGIGMDIPFSSGTFMIEARLTPSLKSIYKNDLGVDEKNISYSLSLGYSPGKR